jgi:hypothetical protein
MNVLSSTDRDYLRRREAEEREAAAKAADGARMAHLELAKLYAIRLGHNDDAPSLRVVGG